jgi:PAS domain S-box-containing protein
MPYSERRTVLVVDDETLVTQSISAILQKHGYDASTASSADQALEKIRLRRPELILMDIDLGKGIDGIEAAEMIIREFGTPILFLSGHTEPAVVSRTEDVSSYGFVFKDAGEAVLIVSVKMAFRLCDARKDAEAREFALRASERRYRSLFDEAPAGYHELNLEGRITNVNRTELQMLDYTREEMIGHPIWNFIVEPESRGATLAKLAGKLQPGKTYERTFRRKNGSTFPVFIDDVILHDNQGNATGIRSTIQDISQHKEAEQQLRESEERYRVLIENAAEVVTVIQDGRIKYANPQAERLSGYARKELIGKSMLDLTVPEDRERIRALHDLRVQGKTIPPDADTSRIVRKDGTIKWVEVKFAIISWGGAPATLNFYVDISDRKDTEHALAHALEEKNALLKELQHRIKNSLTMITSLISLESSRVSDPTALSMLENLRNRVNSLTRLYALMDLTGEVQRIRIDDYFRHIVSSLSNTYLRGRSSIRIDERYDPIEIEAKMAAPCGLILNELLTNCLKYAFPEGRAGHILVDVSQHQEEIVIIVSDNGVGTPANFSIEQSTGFGMGIIRLLVEQLHGRITFQQGEKTAFTTYLPCE